MIFCDLNMTIKIISNEAMILAAGYGKRMLPLSDRIPKALVTINKKPLIEHCIEKLKNVGIDRVVVNTHHLSSKINEFIGTKNYKIDVLYEKKILDTGGGILNAIKKEKIGKYNSPFFVLNGDSFWVEKNSPLKELSKFWDEKKMDLLLILSNKDKIFGYKGFGDYDFADAKDKFGRLSNRWKHRKYVFTGVQLLNPKILKKTTKKVFSMKEIFTEAMNKKKLFGLVDENEWYHVGTTKTLDEINRKL